MNNHSMRSDEKNSMVDLYFGVVEMAYAYVYRCPF